MMLYKAVTWLMLYIINAIYIFIGRMMLYSLNLVDAPV